MTRDEFESAKFHDARMASNILVLMPVLRDRRLLIEHVELIRALIATWGDVLTTGQIAELRAAVEMREKT